MQIKLSLIFWEPVCSWMTSELHIHVQYDFTQHCSSDLVLSFCLSVLHSYLPCNYILFIKWFFKIYFLLEYSWITMLITTPWQSDSVIHIYKYILFHILFLFFFLSSVQFSSVAHSCPTLYGPMNCTMPGLPVHHHLLEFIQTHVHWVGDAIQPSHPLSFPFPPAPKSLSASESFPMSQLVAWGGQSTEVSALASFLQTTPRTDLLQNGLVGSPCSPWDSQEYSPTPQFKSINSSALSFLHSPTLTSIHDYWKNNSLD